MPLDQHHPHPLYLTGRLAALGDVGDARLDPAETSLALTHPQRALPMLVKRIQAAGRDAAAGEVMNLIPAEGLPAGPVRIEQQMEYWLGYYHQRAYPRHVVMDRAQIEEAGKTLYGEQWQSDLARQLGWDSSRVRQVLSGYRPMPGGAVADIVAMLRQRANEAVVVADAIERLLITATAPKG